MWIRDFTDDAKRGMLKALEVSENGFYGLKDFEELQSLSASLSLDYDTSYYSDIKRYYFLLIEKYEVTRPAVEKIFTDVYAVDSSYAAKLKAHLGVVQELRQMFHSLVAAIDTAPAGGSVPALELGNVDFTQALGASIVGLYNATISRFVSEDGTYDWKAIDATLNRDAKDISEAEYFVLALLYSSMGISDTERFLQSLADKVADVHGKPLSVPSDYTEWVYDPVKVKKIQDHVDAFGLTYIMAAAKIDNYSYDDITGLYAEMYPNGANTTPFEQQREIVADLKNQAYVFFQQSAFLTAANNLLSYPPTDYPFESELSGPLTGEAGASWPNISLTKEGDEYVLSFCNIRKLPLEKMGEDKDFYLNTNNNKIMIGSVIPGTSASDKIIDNIENFYTAKYTFEEDDFVEITVKTVVGALLGEIPYSGFATIPIDVVSGPVEAMNKAGQDLREIEQSVDALRGGDYCRDFWLNTVIINNGAAFQQVVIYPGYDTQDVINNLNYYVVKEGKNLEDYGMSGQVTMEDVLKRPSDVTELLNSFKDRDLIVNPEKKPWIEVVPETIVGSSD